MLHRVVPYHRRNMAAKFLCQPQPSGSSSDAQDRFKVYEQGFNNPQFPLLLTFAVSFQNLDFQRDTFLFFFPGSPGAFVWVPLFKQAEPIARLWSCTPQRFFYLSAFFRKHIDCHLNIILVLLHALSAKATHLYSMMVQSDPYDETYACCLRSIYA